MIAKMRIFAKLVIRATTAAMQDVLTSVLALLKPDLRTGTMKPAVRKMLMMASAVNIGTEHSAHGISGGVERLRVCG